MRVNRKALFKSALLCIMFVMGNRNISGAATINVPLDYPAIQEAIDAASDGDIVSVAAGTYNEDINFSGKDIAVKSVSGCVGTIIKGTGAGSVVTFSSGETQNARLEGFTITGGAGTKAEDSTSTSGGGILCDNSSPVIKDCTICSNVAQSGGGICSYFGNPQILKCRILRNQATMGAGIEAYRSDIIISGCEISDNFSNGSGGGILAWNSSAVINECKVINNEAFTGGGINLTRNMYDGNPSCAILNTLIASNHGNYSGGGIKISRIAPCITNCVVTANTAAMGAGLYTEENAIGERTSITNCTFAMNHAETKGGAILSFHRRSPQAVNSIFWKDTANGKFNELAHFAPEIAEPFLITYSDIKGGYPGEGNINQDPLLNYAFKLRAGSPCIDKGADYATTACGLSGRDFEGDNRPQDGNLDGAFAYDMGADEYATTPTALLHLNESVFHVNDTLKIASQFLPGKIPTRVDFYFRVILPDGTIRYYPNWNQTPAPVRTDFIVRELYRENFFKYLFRKNSLAGQYTAEIYFTKPGTTEIIGRINNVTFNCVK